MNKSDKEFLESIKSWDDIKSDEELKRFEKLTKTEDKKVSKKEKIIGALIFSFIAIIYISYTQELSIIEQVLFFIYFFILSLIIIFVKRF